MLIIGSVAAKAWIPSFRDPKDLDVWMLPEEFSEWYDKNLGNIISFTPERVKDKYFVKFNEGNKTVSIEIRILTDDCSQLMLHNAQRHHKEISVAGGTFKVASIKTLLRLKRSHLEFPLRWEKHIADYAELMNYYRTHQAECDAQQDNDLLEVGYKKLYKATAQYFGATKANLNMSNDDFFAKSEAKIRRIYDHDSIHRAVMFYDQPMFEKIKDDLSKASCSKELWDDLSYGDKVRAVQEEAMVIALERKVLPKMITNESFDANKAYAWALQRICTNLTSGWFRNFALDNWRECFNLGFDYTQKLDKNRLVINE